jgi:hypothetical protein
MGLMRNVCEAFVGISEGNRPLIRHERRWENKERMAGCGRLWQAVEWIHWAQAPVTVLINEF